MNRKLFYKILIGIASFALLIIIFTVIFLEPLLGKMIQTTLNKENTNYIFKIKRAHVLLPVLGLELQTIKIYSKQKHAGLPDLEGEIQSIKFKGINFSKAIFEKDIDVREIAVSGIRISGTMSFRKKSKKPVISSLNIRIGKVRYDKINMELKYDSTSKAYSVKEGLLTIYDLQINKKDTLTPGIFTKFDFEAKELISVSPDSMYSYKAQNISFSTNSNKIAISNFSIHPNYTEYAFTAHYKYETDRIEASFNKILISDFPVAGYLNSGNMESSFIEIGKMDMKVFRDKRKVFRHVNKPEFQDMIYNYPGIIHIDSMRIKSGNVVYTEHAERANKPGNINFNEINAKFYNISNRKIFKSESAFLVFEGEALLMGKGKMTVLLKAKIFDSFNTFSLSGTLAEMEVSELNPILEKNAFLYVTSGKIDAMKYSFTANNTKASGNLILRYHGLNIALKNKRTDDTTALKEKFNSLIANIKVVNANPLPGKEVRTGTINYERDPEKFLLNYCYKSILSGIKASISRKEMRKKKS